MIQGEMVRMQSLNQYIIDVGGYSPYLYEDMVEETTILMQEILSVMPDRTRALEIVLQKFNDEGSSSAIIYHLRLLAASWLKGHPELEPFTQGLGLAGYCSEWLERPNKEIDHLGIVLLSNVLLKEAGFVLEIAYLDRSPGSQVTVYRFPDEHNGQDPSTLGPMMHLLYRPDHYDILYRHPPVVIEVHRAMTYPTPLPKPQGGSVLQLKPADVATTAAADYQTIDLLPLADLPGAWMGLGTSLATGSLLVPASESPLIEPFSTAAAPPPAATWPVPPFQDPLSIRPATIPVNVEPTPPPPPPPQPQSQPHPVSQPQAQLQSRLPQHPQPQLQPKPKPQKPQKLQVVSRKSLMAGGGAGSTPKRTSATGLSPRSPQPATPSPSSTTSAPMPDPVVRFSAWKHLFDTSHPWPADRDQPQFKTNTFKNSHFNVAHFNNPNFQPEPYRPANDHADTSSSTTQRSPTAGSSSAAHHDSSGEVPPARTKGSSKRGASGSDCGAVSTASAGDHCEQDSSSAAVRRASRGCAGWGGGGGSGGSGGGGGDAGCGCDVWEVPADNHQHHHNNRRDSNHHQAKRRATRGGDHHA